MTELINDIYTPNQAEMPGPTSGNPVIANCYSIWQRVYKAEIAKGVHYIHAGRTAGLAYRRAMPQLTGQDNIRDFIACVAHGLLIGAIEENTGAKLLYAAQIAHNTARGLSVTQKTAVE
jgi:hypothetical protein